MSALNVARLQLAAAVASLLLIIVGGVAAVMGSWHLAANGFLWALVLQPWDRRPRLAKNQAIVTAPIEPSADMRHWASVVTQARTALINEGNSPEETNRLLADWLVALGREGDR